jgi:hypothetical protein
MKTLLSLCSILLLTAGAVKFDAARLDAGALFTAVLVAALFAFAATDGRRGGRPVRVA